MARARPAAARVNARVGGLLLTLCALSLSVPWQGRVAAQTGEAASPETQHRAAENQQKQPEKNEPHPAVKLQATYTGDGVANLRGGRRRGLVHLGTLQLTLLAKLDKLVGWPGARLFLHTLTSFGGHPSRLVGDVQALDNMAAPTIPLSLYEAWIEQNLLQLRLSLLAGFYDVNSEFQVSHPGMLFLHSAQGIGSAIALSGPRGPSIFPVTSPGARIKVVPIAPVYAQVAVLSGHPGNLGGPQGLQHDRSGRVLVVYEAGGYLGLAPAPAPEPMARRRYLQRQTLPHYRAKFAVGGFAYSGRAPGVERRVGEATATHHVAEHGLYALADALVFKERASSREGLWLFARLGSASPAIDAFPLFMGGGVVYQGLFPGRGDDELGLAVAVARAGAPYRRARTAASMPSAASEQAWELTYLAHVTSWLTIHADLQYIVHPSADPSIPNALVLMARYQIGF